MPAPDTPLRFEVEGLDEAAPPERVVVLLHGRGADRHDLRGLHRHLPAGTTLVTPEAPHPGPPWGYGTGWAWYRYMAEDRVVTATLNESLEQLDAFLDRLPEILGHPADRIVIGGFSQGGTTALAWALSRPGRAAGVVMMSGFLVDAPDTVALAPDAVADLPIFWGHGFGDPAIPHALAVRGRAKLESVDAELSAHDYPMGHQITPREMDDLTEWLEAIQTP